MSEHHTSSEFPCRTLDNDTLGSAPGCGGCAFMTGAAVAFGLMGMFEAIRTNYLGLVAARLIQTVPGYHMKVTI